MIRSLCAVLFALTACSSGSPKPAQPASTLISEASQGHTAAYRWMLGHLDELLACTELTDADITGINFRWGVSEDGEATEVEAYPYESVVAREEAMPFVRCVAAVVNSSRFEAGARPLPRLTAEQLKAARLTTTYEQGEARYNLRVSRLGPGQ